MPGPGIEPMTARSEVRRPTAVPPRHNWLWIGLSSVLRPRQHSIDYMGDGFYRSKDPANIIKVLKVHTVHREIKHTIIKQ